jgi:predicted nucleic acid-binding protein
MNDWVVDSSVVAKWVLAEPDSAQALRVVTETATRKGQLFVLDLAMVEVTNVIWTRYHRRLLTLAEASQARLLLEQAVARVVPSLPLLAPAFLLAAQFDVAVYDALFVAAARDLGVGGVTADEPLLRTVAANYPELRLLRNW